jgi:hypothetical protein
MLREFRIPEIFLGVFLTVAVFAIGYVVASSVPPPSQQIETTNHQQAANEGAERTAEKQIAYYTKWLAWFTGALVAVSFTQGYFLLRSDKTARISANAADRSARAAIAVQLPIIRIHPEDLGRGDGKIGGLSYEECSVAAVILSNLGPTKAFPLEILYGFTIGNELPPEPSYRYLESFLPNFILDIDPSTTPRKRLTMAMPLKPGEGPNILKGNYLWFYCALRYEDFMGEIHSHGFCWQWSYGGAGLAWRIDDSPAYNRKT